MALADASFAGRSQGGAYVQARLGTMLDWAVGLWIFAGGVVITEPSPYELSFVLVLAMSLPAVMQHLQVLELAGLVRSQKVGRVRTCTIDSGALSLAEQWINDRRSGWERRFDRLDVFLAETAPPNEEDQK